MKRIPFIRIFHVAICNIVLAVVYVATSLAEDSSEARNCEQKLSLTEFRALAFNNSPLIAEIDREYANELAKAVDTEILANPEVQVEQTFTSMKIDGANDSQSQVSIGQPVKLSNFGKRADVAFLIRKAGDIDRRARVLELTQKIIIQFKTLYVYQQLEKIIADAEQRASKKVSLIHSGVKKGLFSEGDEKLFEGEMYRLQSNSKGISSSVYSLQNELGKSIGLSCSISAVDNTQLEELPSLSDLLQKAKENELSESIRLDLQASLTKEQTRLAEIDAYPSITPRFLYQHTNDGGDFFGAGFAMPLPFWNRNQADKMRNNATSKVIEMKNNYLKSGGLESQVRNLRNASITSKEQADLFSTKVIPAFETALTAQEKLYLDGKGNVLQVWQTLRTFNEAQTEGLLFWLEAVAIRAQLSLFIGEEV